MTPLKRNILIGIGAVVIGVAWGWYELSTKPAKESIRAGVQKILKIEPRVRPMYREAMKDGVLTTLEAKAIVDRANELKGR